VRSEIEEELGKGSTAMSVAPETGRNRIMIYGPKPDGTYVVEFETTDGDFASD
jgi:hypothetical protein